MNKKFGTLIGTLLVFAAPLAFAQYKCQGSDGKIEYSDRPCDANKNVLSQPRPQGVTSKAAGLPPMERLKALFDEYEARLCEREKLATEIDMANRSNAISKSPADWKPRQERLSFLNDTLIEFQEKASKITQAAGSDSEESRAVRKFQVKLKDCGKIAK
jgi:hypothetical protein